MADLQQMKPADQKTRQGFSIRMLILSLTILLLFLGMVETVISLAVLRNLQRQTIQTLETANQIRLLGQNILNRFAAARLNEGQFIIRSQTQGYDLQSSVDVSANESDLEFARQYINEIERLASLSSNSSLQSLTEEINRLRPLLDQYQAEFQNIVSAIRTRKGAGGPEDQAISANIAAITNTTKDINQEIDRISTKSEFGVNSAQNYMDRINRQASLIIPIVGILALVLGILAAYLINRQIVPPVTSLSRAAQLMGAGMLDQRVEVRGAAELVTLGGAFNSMATQIRQILSSLEQRVNIQTAKLKDRSLQLQVAAEVARDITATRGDLHDLLNRSVHLIRDRFGFYHAGVFLLDQQGEYAVLHAATGEAGEEMLRHDHKLIVGAEGIVGYVTSIGKPRTSLDVGVDAVHFKNPLLPETRSEIALPLKVGQTIIGALDVQSTEANAFTDEDISVLQLIADQLAIAIDHTRLLITAQDNLRQMQQAYGQYSREAWERLGQARTSPGYYFDLKGIHTLETKGFADAEASPIRSAAADRFPLQMHGQEIGILEVWTEGQDGLTDIERSALTVIADRISQVMDSARLYEDAQVHAAREQTLSQLSAQFSQSLRFDVLLRSAVQELGRLPKVAEASIHIGLPDESSQVREQR